MIHWHSRFGRAPGSVAVGTGARLPVGCVDLCARRSGRAHEWLRCSRARQILLAASSTRVLHPSFLSQTASCDVASSAWPALAGGEREVEARRHADAQHAAGAGGPLLAPLASTASSSSSSSVGRCKLKPVFAGKARNKTSSACITHCPCVMLCDLTTCYSIKSAWFQRLKLKHDTARPPPPPP